MVIFFLGIKNNKSLNYDYENSEKLQLSLQFFLMYFHIRVDHLTITVIISECINFFWIFVFLFLQLRKTKL